MDDCINTANVIIHSTGSEVMRENSDATRLALCPQCKKGYVKFPLFIGESSTCTHCAIEFSFIHIGRSLVYTSLVYTSRSRTNDDK